MATTASLIYAAQLKLTIKRGDTSEIAVSFTNPNDSDNPLNLLAFSDLTMQVKRSTQSTVALLTLTIGNGLSISGNDNETLTILMEDGGGLAADTIYVYDVQGLLSSEPRTILTGTIKVVADVTRT